MFHALYHAIAWTWGGSKWGGAESTGYLLFSGPVADLTMLGVVGVWWRKHNCHVSGCWRLQWHGHPTSGHPVCRRHHPHAS